MRKAALSTSPLCTQPAAQHLAAIRRALLRWFDKHGRALPWRGSSRSAYHVLVSEAMLQQTQVATVIDYYRRFLDAFPNVRVLANAEEQQVLRLWQGLGYYRRARLLHAAAKMIVAQHGDEVPGDVNVLLTLPGVGRYTAGAIASIAHGKREPILDGNVARVLARWFAMDQSIDDANVKKQLWTLATALVPMNRPGDFNEAMMDLGATVCTPRKPACLTCPMSNLCAANTQQRVDELPIRTVRRKPTAVTHHIIAIERRGRWLFEQRPTTGLWANMWQMPTHELPRTLTCAELADWLHDRFGLAASRVNEVATFVHQTTHRTITFVLHRALGVTGRLNVAAAQWRALDDLDDLPLANPQREVVKMLAKTSV